MKLPPIRYYRAAHLDDAVHALAEHGEDARLLAGGQSLVPAMAFRLSRPSVLVDISRARDLLTWTCGEDRLVVSAAVTARRVELDAEVRRRHPLLAAALGYVGHPEIRNRGTVCGSAAHADPAAEVPAILVALDGAMRVIGPTGRRRVAARDFFVGPYMTTLETGEMVAAVEFPLLPSTAGWSVLEIARRRGDFALAGVVCVLDTDPIGICSLAQLALFGVAATPVRSKSGEEALLNRPLDAQALQEAARVSLDDIAVLGDSHGSADYRRSAGAHLVHRALLAAHETRENGHG